MEILWHSIDDGKYTQYQWKLQMLKVITYSIRCDDDDDNCGLINLNDSTSISIQSNRIQSISISIEFCFPSIIVCTRLHFHRLSLSLSLALSALQILIHSLNTNNNYTQTNFIRCASSDNVFGVYRFAFVQLFKQIKFHLWHDVVENCTRKFVARAPAFSSRS